MLVWLFSWLRFGVCVLVVGYWLVLTGCLFWVFGLILVVMIVKLRLTLVWWFSLLVWLVFAVLGL